MTDARGHPNPTNPPGPATAPDWHDAQKIRRVLYIMINSYYPLGQSGFRQYQDIVI